MSAFLNEPSFDNFMDALDNHFTYQWTRDNIRIPQTAGYFLFFLPYVFLCLAASASTVWMFQASAMVAGVWRRNFTAFSVLAFAMVFLLPWYNDMYCTVWCLNYALPAALWAYTLWRWLIAPRPLGASAFFLAFLTAWGHELYGAVLIGSVAGVTIFYRDRRNRTALLLICGALIPIIVATLAPCTSYRANHTGESVFTILFFRYPSWWVYNIMALPTLALAAISGLNGRVRRRCSDAVYWAVGFGALAGLVVSCLMGGAPRVSWGVNLGGILFWLMFIQRMWPKVLHRRRILTAVLWTVVAVSYIAAIRLAWEYRSLIDDAEQNRDAESGTYRVSFVKYPPNDFWTNLITARKVSSTSGIDWLEDRKVYPYYLQNFTPESSRRLSTDLKGATLYQYGQHIIGKVPEERPDSFDIIIKGSGKEVRTNGYFLPLPLPTDTFTMVNTKEKAFMAIALQGVEIDSVKFIRLK